MMSHNRDSDVYCPDTKSTSKKDKDDDIAVERGPQKEINCHKVLTKGMYFSYSKKELGNT